MSKSSCHSGNPLVFDTGIVKVYAGGTNREGGWHRMATKPDLAMGPRGVIISNKSSDLLPKGWKSSGALIGGGHTIVMEIDWPDYGIPKNLGPSWWDALIEDIAEKGITSISTQCMGGHGRTGVQLAILAHKLIPKKDHTWKDAAELITHIRDCYCTHAVEAKQQQTYVADCCGIPEGKSVVTVQTNTWATVDFDESMILTDDEMEAEIRANENGNKKKAKKKKAKKKNGKRAERYDTPIKKGWTLTRCPQCNEYEWRRATEDDMEIPCRLCHSAPPYPADDELISGMEMVRCTLTDKMWHPIEMLHHGTSYEAEAHERGMKIREMQDADGMPLGTEVKVGTTWQPTWWLDIDEEGEFTTAGRLYMAMRKQEKEEEDEPSRFTSKHQSTLDLYRQHRRRDNQALDDELDAMVRESNDDIEAED